MSGVNQVTLIGNVGAEPESRTTGGGTKVVKLSLATNRKYNDRNGQKQEDTQWHRCTVFGKGADVVEQYVKKGDRLYVRGRIEYSQTQDDSGNVKYWTDVVVEDFQMLGSTSTPNTESKAGSAIGEGGSPFAERDSLPF